MSGAWEHLAAIADAGIGCLKIEGRKKKPEYVATATRSYRTFLNDLASSPQIIQNGMILTQGIQRSIPHNNSFPQILASMIAL